MSQAITRATLLALIEQDEAFYQKLREAGLVPERDDALSTEHLEAARVAHTLVSELQVNWEGVEIVLRMRSELIASRRQVAELIRLLAQRP